MRANLSIADASTDPHAAQGEPSRVVETSTLR
jgi:hypothetical protein